MKTKELTQLVDDITSFLEREKKRFTEEFYKGIDRNKLSLKRQLELRDKYNVGWSKKEDEIFSKISG